MSCNHVTEVSQEVFENLLAEIEESKAKRAEKMPTENDAFKQMFEAYQRLQELGWKDAMYAPRGGGDRFESYYPGSTAKAKDTHRDEQGRFWVFEAGDIWPAMPALIKIPSNTDATSE